MVAERIRAALKFIDAERLIPAPDCGMKYLLARSGLRQAEGAERGAAIVRRELG